MAARVPIWFSLLALAVVAGSFFGMSLEEAESEEFVLTLDHSNFSNTVAKHKFIVVQFYAPWCGHCRKLAPEYEKAASILSSHDPQVVLAKVDADKEPNKELASRHGVRIYPTLQIFRDGGKSVQEYKGPRDADGIVSYLKKQSRPASAEIKSVEDAGSLIDENKIVIVGVFPKFSGEEFKNFTAFAEKLRSDYDFGHTLDAKLLSHGESSVSGPIVRLFKPFDELFVDFQDFNLEALEKFVETSSIPVLTIFNNDPNNHPFIVKFFDAPESKAMLFVSFDSEAADSFKSKYYEVAEKYRGDGIRCLLADAEYSESAFQYFGLQYSLVPFIIIQTSDGTKYLKANLEPDDVASLLQDYKEGKVSPYFISEEIPEENNDPVKVVVAYSLQDMVFKSGKNVLLEFYAPWCENCRGLESILNEVAVHYENDSDIMIAKFDASVNEIADNSFDVRGYPAVYFRSASGKVSSYVGDTTVEDFIDYIEKNRDQTTHQEEVGRSES